ncbi:MAG: lytic transglycosylase domain-containing protein, partial [Dermatophilaceae bacterium]
MRARWTQHLTESLVASGLLLLGILFGAMSPQPGVASATRLVGSLASSGVGRAGSAASMSTVDGWSVSGAGVWPGALHAGEFGPGDGVDTSAGKGASAGVRDAGAVGPMVGAAVVALWGAAGGGVTVIPSVPSAPGSAAAESAVSGVASTGPRLSVPEVLWNAYAHASAQVRPSCHLPSTLLAAIGQIESGSLAGRALTPSHDVVPPVFGPVLSGGAFAAIPDTDGGRLDGDPVWDRAVGPMQFIPATWRVWGRDGNNDGVANPQNVDDAALSAATYLCARGRDLSDPAQLRAAILSYNSSNSYAAAVLHLMGSVTPRTPRGSSMSGGAVTVVTVPGVTVTMPGVTVTSTVTSVAPSTAAPTQSRPATVTQTVLVTVTASPPTPSSTTSKAATSTTATTPARATAASSTT